MLSDPPNPDEFEISIFGPGRGESIVVHLGQGDWMVVDSCVDQAGSNPALEYLRQIEVDVAKSVRLVVVTHAHDDHFKGISDIYRACESAFLVCSEAFTAEELYALSELEVMNRHRLKKAALVEYRKLNEIVEQRGRRRFGVAQMHYGSERKQLLDLRSPNRASATVTALSPSSYATLRARKKFARELTRQTDSIRSVAIDPNEISIALWVEVGDNAALLGADLLKGPAGCGWEAILTTFSPRTRASLIKVPHHGSASAHHDGVWDTLLTQSPVAMLTPFRLGRRSIPTQSDRARLLRLTPDVYITAPSRPPTPGKRFKREREALGPLAINVREPSSFAGHVRARIVIGQDVWTILRASPALRLRDAR